MWRKLRKSRAGPVLWGLAASLYLLGLLAERLLYSSSVSCELSEDSSIFGEPGWSWVPLGHTCTWDNVREGITFTDYPTMMSLAPVMVLLLWGVSLILTGRAEKLRVKQESSNEGVS